LVGLATIRGSPKSPVEISTRIRTAHFAFRASLVVRNRRAGALTSSRSSRGESHRSSSD
jgi:hypothetical protein